MRQAAIAIFLMLLTARRSTADVVVNLDVDCSKQIGVIRALHGGNGGVLCDGGLTDLSAYFRDVQIPLMRLHDCHWPNADVVDMHVVFPNPQADPADPKSYDFRKTDEYIAAIRATGSKIVYRLGESIEHTPTKYHVHPPTDPHRWAAACVGIVRHYKDSVEYWEIWNEPENHPAMWTGSDEQYLELYELTSKAIKKEFLAKVGGPALGYSGKIVEAKFEPSAFLLKFLAHCKSRSLPLDFFSWHLYSDDPGECVIRARGLRELLDRSGFSKAEMHLNEWNYLPANDWRPVTQAGQGELRRKFNEQLAGPAAAAFVASVLINLQDSPVDQANIFRADNGGFGLFAPDGTPNKTFYAFKAFRMLLENPVRLEAKGADNICICAGMNEAKNQLTILVSNYTDRKTGFLSVRQLPWKGKTQCQIWTIDAKNDLVPSTKQKMPADDFRIPIALTAPSVCVIRLDKAD